VILGDFGLACLMNYSDDDQETRSSLNHLPFNEIPKSSDENDDDDANGKKALEIFKPCENQQFLSSGIGTVTYSAPEQMKGGRYDHKVRI